MLAGALDRDTASPFDWPYLHAVEMGIVIAFAGLFALILAGVIWERVRDR